jgi:hypothetical protein
VRLGNVRGFRHVAGIVADFDAVPGQQFACGLQVGRAAREDRDLRTRGGKLPRNRQPKALAAASDGGDAILHRDLHVVLPLAVFLAAGWIGSEIIMVPRAGMIKHTLVTRVPCGFAFPSYW